jgi:hypothetical protein
MFDQLFKRPFAVARHVNAPYAEERRQYLAACAQQRNSRSTDTTHVYAEVDLEMKAKALALCCDVPHPGCAKPWHKDAGIIGFLRAL